MEGNRKLKPYITISKCSETEIVINKSRFIGRAFPVSSEEEAQSHLAAIRKKHYDATHNCYAYSILDGTMRFSDDGEPGGTAGMPMMEVVKAKSVQNVICIVTRYFGGILLGAGGLVRAYSRTCAEAIDLACPVLMKTGVSIEIVCDYSRYNALEMFIRDNSFVSDVEFLENVTVHTAVASENAEKFIDAVVQKTDGVVVPKTGIELYIPSEP